MSKPKQTTVNMPLFNMTVQVFRNGSGTIKSELKQPCPCCGSPECFLDCPDSKMGNTPETEVDARQRLEFNCRIATPAALEVLIQSGQSPAAFLGRHANGDWGDVDEEDWQANQDALKEGARLLSSYRTRLGHKIWIITEADRSATTILLPEEY